jgi:excisionase family DNA binding protein
MAKQILIELDANETIEIQLTRRQVTVVPVQEPRKQEKRFFPLDWLVEYTGIPKNSIYQLTSKNLIPHIKRGRKLFFEKVQIDNWLEEGRVKSNDEIVSSAEQFLTKRGRRMDK